MAEESKVRAALVLLRQAGCMDLLREEALAPGRLARRALAGVAAAVAVCSPPHAGAEWQVRGVGRLAGGIELKGVAGAGKRRARRRARGFQGLPLGLGAPRLRLGAVERSTASGKARRERRDSPGQEGQGRVRRLRGLARVNGKGKWQYRAKLGLWAQQ
ncbi:hypothetical protein NDU88_005777 [Pleurodeles waltl]|uniref:Uncharacterized protein n=1 Tax=Pleurodeles waltl TaxID=8319 RepID=A0AAV7NRC2_PLEWA|nr:hypothetical protein NDU88_005777 [Pleurodeles waltl]